MGWTPAGAEEQREEEGAAERNCYGLTATPIPQPSALPRVQQGGGSRVRSQAEPEKKKGLEGEGGFSFVSTFHCPTLISIGNKLN